MTPTATRHPSFQAQRADQAKVLVVFDAHLEGLEILQAGLLDGVAQRSLTAHEPALPTITAWLAETGARELVLVAHGRPGQVLLGSQPITTSELDHHRSLLLEWGIDSIRLLSCHVGADPAFLRALEASTGARVQASTALVGAAAMGGSWDVLADGQTVFQRSALQKYPYTLPSLLNASLLNPFTTGNNTKNYVIQGGILSQRQVFRKGTPQFSDASDVLLGIYSADLSTLLYWSVLKTGASNGNSGNFTFNIPDFVANGQYDFVLWAGDYDGNSGDSGTGALPGNFDVNPRLTGRRTTPKNTTRNTRTLRLNNVIVGPVFNSSPVATFTTEQGATEDGASITGILTATDSDAGDTLSYALLGEDIAGLSIDASGNWSFDPTNAAYQELAQDDELLITVDYQVTDSAGGSDTESFFITVTGVNDAPTATFTTAQSATEDGASITGTLTASEVDNGDILSYDLVGEDIAGLSIDASGNWSFDPANVAYQSLAAGTTQVVSINYIVDDGNGGSDTESFAITVTGVNDAPTATYTTAQFATEDGSSLTGSLTASEVDNGDILSYSLVGEDIAGLSIDASGSWSFDPANLAYQSLAAGITQVVSVNYIVNDGNGGSDTESFDITVTGVNDAPTATFTTTQSTTEDGASFTGSLTASEVDAGDILSYDLVGADIAGLIIDASGSWSFDPANAAYQSLDAGSTQVVSVNYSVNDGNGGSDTESFDIIVTGVNDAPTATYTTHRRATEDGSSITGTLTATDIDAGDITFTYAAATETAGLTINTNGTWSFDPTDVAYQSIAAGSTQVVTVNYTVSDTAGASDTESFDITITGVNDAPTATFTSTQSATEDGASIAGTLTASDVDTDDIIDFTLAGAAIGGLTINTDGSWVFDPTDAAYQSIAAGSTQVVTVNYIVDDGNGSSDTESFDIIVTGVNDAPTATFTTAQSATEDGASITGSLTVSDLDVGDSFTYAAVGTAPGGVSIDASGNWSFDPTDAAYQSLASGSTQVVTVNYEVSDASGASDTESFDITVTGVNDAPTATFTTAQSATEDGASISGSLTVSDLDVGDTFTYAAVGTPPGGVSIDASGNWSFDPTNAAYQSLASGSTQVVTVNYAVSDASGASDTESFAITVTGVNDAPTATYTTPRSATEDGASIIGSLTVSDIDVGDTFTYAAVGTPPGGVSIDASGNWSFNPANAAYQSLATGITQVVTVNYRVSDASGASDTESFAITVTGVNDAATISGTTTGSVTEASSSNAGTPTASGDLNSTDPDAGESDRWTSVSPAVTTTSGYGSFTIDGSGNWLYTLDNNNATVNALSATQSMTDSFSVTTIDGTSQTLTVTIQGAADISTLTGTTVADTLNVATATNSYQIFGLAGDDTITGSNFDDTITGSTGADRLTGGSGVNTYVLSTGDGGGARTAVNVSSGQAISTITFGAAIDIITDFKTTDKLDVVTANNLTTIVNANTNMGGVTSNGWARGTLSSTTFTYNAASGTDILVVYDVANATFNNTGNNTSNYVLLQGFGGSTLTTGNFI